MNYRHIFHAGGIADLVKHGVLMLLLDRLRAKETPYCVIDTHAGIGRYDLTVETAQKTSEAQAGIGILREAGPHTSGLLALIRRLDPANSGDKIQIYPGSPLIAGALKRDSDRLILCELHPEDVLDLRRACRGIANTAVHHRDGYEALKAFLPPVERRGLVLIDPPFEQPDEMRQLVISLEKCWNRWPTGQYAVWYPIKERSAVDRFHAALHNIGLRKVLIVEFMAEAVDQPATLNGSGLLLVNPPWQIEGAISAYLAELKIGLSRPNARTRVEWLIGE